LGINHRIPIKHSNNPKEIRKNGKEDKGLKVILNN
jgi:hypothetical protein